MPSCCDQQSDNLGGGKRGFDWLLALTLAVCILSGILHFGDAPWMSATPRLAHFSHAIVELFSKMWWGLLAGILAIGILSHVPREWITAALGKGLFRAIGLGLLFDLCIHGILLVGAKLYERGATLGQTFAFLIASPWNSFSVSLVLIGLIGLPWTLLFTVLSALVAVGAGIAADTLVKRGVLFGNPNRLTPREDFSLRHELSTSLRAIPWHPKLFLKLLSTGIRESKMLVRWIFLGVILASLRRAYVSDAAFSTWFGATWMGLCLTMIATTLIEVCSEGSSPLAADLLHRGHAPGNAFAFLMGGVATDYTEMMVLRQTMGSWKFALTLPIVTVPQVMVLGWLINHLATR